VNLSIHDFDIWPQEKMHRAMVWCKAYFDTLNNLHVGVSHKCDRQTEGRTDKHSRSKLRAYLRRSAKNNSTYATFLHCSSIVVCCTCEASFRHWHFDNL